MHRTVPGINVSRLQIPQFPVHRFLAAGSTDTLPCAHIGIQCRLTKAAIYTAH